MKITIIIVAIILATMTIGTAIAKEQITEAKAQIPLNSMEYNGAEFTFVVAAHTQYRVLISKEMRYNQSC